MRVTIFDIDPVTGALDARYVTDATWLATHLSTISDDLLIRSFCEFGVHVDGPCDASIVDALVAEIHRRPSLMGEDAKGVTTR